MNCIYIHSWNLIFPIEILSKIMHLQNLWLMRVQILQWTLKFNGLGIIYRNNNMSVSSLVPKGLHGDEASQYPNPL